MSLKVLDSPKSFAQRVADAAKDKLNGIVNRKLPEIKKQIDLRIPGWIEEQPEMQSLLMDATPYELPAEFGLPRGQGQKAVSDIVSAIAASTNVKTSNISLRTKNISIEFELVPGTFRELMNLPHSKVVYEKGILPWVEWLLTAGDSIIVTGYKYTPFGDGRSGGGVMTKGNSWRVPPKYSGTEIDNFVTRALNDRGAEIAEIVESVVKR